MSEETGQTGGTPFAGGAEQGGAQPGQQQNVQIFVDDRELRSVFCNFYQIHTAMEEVILDLGFNMQNPRPVQQQAGQPAQAQLLLKVQDRVIMSYPTVKRLAASLTQLVKRFEQQFGEIPTQPGQRR